MTTLSKSQLRTLIQHSIDKQQIVANRLKTEDTQFNRLQLYWFKQVYKTAFHYFDDCSSHCVDGIGMLSYNELISQYELITSVTE